MKLSIGKKMALGFTFGLVALTAISVVSYRNVTAFTEDASWVTHTVEVLRHLEAMFAGVMQAQADARGYALSPNADFPKLIQAASADVNEQVAAVRTLTADNLNQQKRLDELGPLISERQELLQKLMDLSRSSAADREAQVAETVTKGQRITDEIRDLISQMEGEEKGLLTERQKQAGETAARTTTTITYGTGLAIFAMAIAGLLVTRSITTPLEELGEGATKIGAGDYAQRVPANSGDEVGRLGGLFNKMAEQVQQRQIIQQEQDWLKTSLVSVSSLLQGQRDPAIIGRTLLEALANLMNARHSVIYWPDAALDGAGLKLLASYAHDNPDAQIKPGEGLVGQCLVEKKRILLRDIPDDYLKIRSALGSGKPACIVVQPALFEGRVKAVFELAAFQQFTEIQLLFLDSLAQSVSLVLTTVEAGMKTEKLLKETQELAANLQSQTERLIQSEQELQQQQEELKQSNEEMEQTNEELRQTTEELEEKTNLLTDQKKELEGAYKDVETARTALEEKARQLAVTSKYKSEFLANMSHELRTPLNSLLILSKMLADNLGNNLTPKQTQYAQTIYSSGNDLLELINDILDLSKIESGNVELQPEEMPFADLQRFVEETFRHVAEGKSLEFRVTLEPALPKEMETDPRRLEQVIKNLLANAFKFTSKGSVELNIAVARRGWDPACKTLNQAETVIVFAVKDTGIGIPPEKQQLIFEAFQQADAGTSRKYGGTGLGLSISRELTRLLGGSLQVQSKPGEGSTFRLFLPAVFAEGHAQYLMRQQQEAMSAPPAAPLPAREEPAVALPVPATANGLADDRANLHPGDMVLLIIEDDRNFAGLLMDFAREKKFKAVVAQSASEGIALAGQIKPSAITLDLVLPDNDGWMVLDWLKHQPQMRHIPVHVISVDEERERSLRLGAVSFLQKPVTKDSLDNALAETIEFINHPVKKLLIVEDNATQRQNIVDLIGNSDVVATAVGSAAEALDALEKNRFDCVVVDLVLPDMTGTKLIEEIQKRYGLRAPPVIVYTGKELSRQEETELRRISESIIIKDVRSPERLLDETALFLHRVQSKLPESKRRMIEQVQKTDSILAGRKVLIVDDDVRNIFAVTAALESRKMQVLFAENGQAGIELLQKNPDTEAVLMDVMMPEMDGFEATRRIRQMPQFKKLPIISVTAKAMKGDREKCLEAGASDYITKPVNMDQLCSLLRVWLYK